MADAYQLYEKAIKFTERQIVLLKEEISQKESARNNCRQNGSIPDMSEYAKKSDVPSNSVTSTAVTSIVKVTELPEEPDPNTLYLVVEEEATTTSETDSEV